MLIRMCTFKKSSRSVAYGQRSIDSVAPDTYPTRFATSSTRIWPYRSQNPGYKPHDLLGTRRYVIQNCHGTSHPPDRTLFVLLDPGWTIIPSQVQPSQHHTHQCEPPHPPPFAKKQASHYPAADI
jgi:hypothetical protein